MDFSTAYLTKAQSGSLIMEPLHLSMVSLRLSRGISIYFHFSDAEMLCSRASPGAWEKLGRSGLWMQAGVQVRGSWHCVRIHEG